MGTAAQNPKITALFICVRRRLTRETLGWSSRAISRIFSPARTRAVISPHEIEGGKSGMDELGHLRYDIEDFILWTMDMVHHLLLIASPIV